MSQDLDHGSIRTNDPKDAIIARLVERTEWMIKTQGETSRIIERLDQTLDHVSEANSRLSQAVDGLTKAVGDQEDLKKGMSSFETRLALVESETKFWRGVRDRIFWIGLAFALAAFGAGWGGSKLTERPAIELSK